MIDETRNVSLPCCVNDLIRVERHEVEVFVVVLGVLLSAPLELRVIEDFTLVLHHELTPDGMKSNSSVEIYWLTNARLCYSY